MTVKELERIIFDFAPKSLKEDYDNVGLLVGDYSKEVSGVIISLDLDNEVLEEAIRKKCNVILTHHPIIFGGLKRITENSFEEKIIIKAIKNDISIIAGHTNVDNAKGGVNYRIAEKIGLQNINVLSPKNEGLSKIVVFTPIEYSDKVREALFFIGAGNIGDYDSCSFSSTGNGTFRAGENTNPFVGEKNKLHKEVEERIETIVPEYLVSKCISTIKKVHPYEEPAYDIYKLHNDNYLSGSGVVGELEEALDEVDFLLKIKKIFNVETIRHSTLLNKKIQKVALCGGSGSFLINKAKNIGADIFISADIKYHDFFKSDNQILIADIGHYESEQFTKELFSDLIMKKNVNFAVHLSEVNTNPVNYF